MIEGSLPSQQVRRFHTDSNLRFAIHNWRFPRDWRNHCDGRSLIDCGNCSSVSGKQICPNDLFAWGVGRIARIADVSCRRCGAQLLIQQVDRAVYVPSFVVVEVEPSADSPVGPATGASSVLIKFVRHSRPVTDHFNQIDFRHLVWIDVKVGVMTVGRHVVLNRDTNAFLQADGIVERHADLAAPMEFRQPDVGNSFFRSKLGQVVLLGAFAQCVTVRSHCSHRRKTLSYTFNVFESAAFVERCHFRSWFVSSGLHLNSRQEPGPQ